MKRKKSWNMKNQFLALTALPIIGLGLIIVFTGYSAFRKALYHQVEEELKSIGNSVLMHFDYTYPGNYSLSGGNTEDGEPTYRLMKGGADITPEYEFLDEIKKNTDIDITIFYGDTRIMTTVRNKQMKRIEGTPASSVIVRDVLNSGEEHFYRKFKVTNIPYFAYYAPIFNSDGTISGIVFAGKPAREINSIISRSLLPISLITVFAILLVSTLSILNSNRLVSSIQRINTFLARVAQGNLNAELDPKILARKDELGDMGRGALTMQNSLRALIELDALTGLNNRRYADKILHQLIASNHSNDSSFTIAIGDIDFFKRVNDTYGHEAGDIVLKGVSKLIKKCVEGKGYASRWGGEEFLFIFENMSYKKSVAALQEFLEELRGTVFTYKELPIQVTMTIGVAVCHPNDTLNILLKYADDKLYKGKSEGRNQIVT